MRRQILTLFSLLVLPYLLQAEIVVIEGGYLIDPSRPEIAGPGTLLIRDGRIAEVRDPEPFLVPEGARVIDARGLYIVPGLADMHNHLRTGTWLLDGDPEPVARSLLGWGITTVLDPASPPAFYRPMKDRLAADPAAYPRTYLARGLFTAPGGWGMPGGYAPETPAEARELVRRIKAAGTDAIKIMYDDMRWATTRPFVAMDPAIMRALVDEAHRQGLKAFVHAPILEFAREAVAAGADGLMHGIISAPVDDGFIALMRERGTSYVSTLALYQTTVQLAALAERLLALDQSGFLDRQLSALLGLPQLGGGRTMNPAWSADRLPIVIDNLRRLHAAGVNIVIGTDSGIPGLLPGTSTHLELQLHVEAGLAPEEVLRAATSAAARMVGRSGEFGGLVPGMSADLLLLAGDPREDIQELRQLVTVLRAGRSHQPPVARSPAVPVPAP
jgi:imidazolonepropionase-like amidohydrolase